MYIYIYIYIGYYRKTELRWMIYQPCMIHAPAGQVDEGAGRRGYMTGWTTLLSHSAINIHHVINTVIIRCSRNNKQIDPQTLGWYVHGAQVESWEGTLHVGYRSQ